MTRKIELIFAATQNYLPYYTVLARSVAANATVTKSVNENNVIVAGFPATIVKRNINWHGNPPTMFNPDNLD